jgi:two-component sensor histidine kinase
VFAIATGGMAAYIIAQDRADTLRVVGERTRSMARMIIAVGDAATDSALQVINTVYPLVENWDLKEPETGRAIYARFHEVVQGNNVIASAWVLNSDGLNVADSWGFPAKQTSGADRPYFKAHVAGAADPLVAGDDKPGSVSGKARFTVSRAVRNRDGSLKAIIAVGVLKSTFDTLYKEAVTWPGARAGLYTTTGDVLARIRNAKLASPAFAQEMRNRALAEPNGTALVRPDDEPRIVSWSRSATHPDVFATSSQPVTAALEQWKARAWTTALTALAVNAVFWGLAWFILRWTVAKQEAEANALAVREVNHRVKNSLQLIASLMHIRARKAEDPAYRDAVKELTSQLTTLSETYRFVQGAASLEEVDAAVTLQGLCRHLEETYGIAIKVDAPPPLPIHANHATAFAVIVNELVTNAVKHGGGEVNVTLKEDKDTVRLAVLSKGGKLPAGFNLDEQTGFGLKAVRTMLQPLGGRMAASNMGEATSFTVSVPAPALRKA